jgi:protein-tyrosine phosphatase
MRPTLYTVVRPGPGQLSTMAKPRGDEWLWEEMAALTLHGVNTLVCALTRPELEETGLTGEPDAARRTGLRFIALPIPDRGIPELDTALPVLLGLAQDLAGGAHIVTHCRFGIGRASLLAAALMVLTGTEPEEAWHLIAEARGLPIPDTDTQRHWPAGLIKHRRT